MDVNKCTIDGTAFAYSSFIYEFWKSNDFTESSSKVLAALTIFPKEIKNGFFVIYIYNNYIEFIDDRDKYKLITIHPLIGEEKIQSLYLKTILANKTFFPSGLITHISKAIAYDIEKKMSEYEDETYPYCRHVIKSHSDDINIVRCLLNRIAEGKYSNISCKSLTSFFKTYSNFFKHKHYHNNNTKRVYDYGSYPRAAQKYLAYNIGPFNTRTGVNRIKLNKFDRFSESESKRINNTEYIVHKQVYRTGGVVDKTKEVRFSQFLSHQHNPNYVSSRHINRRRQSKDDNYICKYDLYLLLGFPLRLDKFIIYDEDKRILSIRHMIDYNKGSVHTRSHLQIEDDELEFVYRKVEGINIRIELNEYLKINLDELTNVEFENLDYSVFDNFIYDQGRIQILKYLFHSVASSEATHSYSAFNSEFLNKHFSKDLKILQTLVNDFCIKSIRIELDESDETSEPFIGCEGSSPYYLCPISFLDIVNEGNYNGDGNCSKASKRVQYQLCIGDRGEKHERTIFIPLGSFLLILRDDKNGYRNCVISKDIFNYDAFVECRSYNTQIINTNLLRHFGVLLILNVFEFDSDIDRMIALKTFLSHAGYLVDAACLPDPEIQILALLSQKFKSYIEGCIWIK